MMVSWRAPHLDRVFLYLERGDEVDPHPHQVRIDGEDVTSAAAIGEDEAAHVVPVVIDLERPLERGSFHDLDGETAVTVIRNEVT